MLTEERIRQIVREEMSRKAYLVGPSRIFDEYVGELAAKMAGRAAQSGNDGAAKPGV